MGDRGESLYVRTEHLRENFRLGDAELGKTAATAATGQWCWQSCWPLETGCTVAMYPSAVRTRASASTGDAAGRDLLRVLRGELGEAVTGVLLDRLGTVLLREVREQVDGQLVVRVLEGVAPSSVGTKTLAGRPRPRLPYGRRSRVVMRPASVSAVRWRRTAAWVSVNSSAISAAVAAPRAMITPSTRPRVPASVSWLVAATSGDSSVFTTPFLRNPVRDQVRVP
jgi:hypothetical protein